MARVDLHTHTRFFHRFRGRPTWFDPIGARLLVAAARARGLDAVAVTNHDYFENFDVPTGEVTLVPGIEVSTTAGHLLVVGPDPPRWTKPGALTPAEVVETARDRGCAVVLAHPFRNSRVADAGVDVDAVEVNGKRSASIDRLEALAEGIDRPLVGGSDAHYPIEVGRSYTTVEGDRTTPEAIVAALRSGRVGYCVDEPLPTQLLRRAYEVVHRLKGHVGRSDRTGP